MFSINVHIKPLLINSVCMFFCKGNESFILFQFQLFFSSQIDVRTLLLLFKKIRVFKD